MTTSKEITALRKDGKLKEARAAALESLLKTPQDRYLQNAYGWVLYEQIKFDIAAYEKSEVQIGELSNTLSLVMGEYSKLDQLQKPDMLHSLLLMQSLKVANDWPGFVSFAKWWNFGLFRDEDKKPYTPPDGGRPIPSMELRTIYAVGRALVGNRVNEEEGAWASEILDDALARYPDDVWLNYYKAKLLENRGSRREALGFLLPVVMRKIHSGWVWGLLGHIIEQEDTEAAVICYFRAINLAGQPSEVLRIRVSLARLLALSERFGEAARQVQKAVSDRIEASYRIPDDLAQLQEAAWYKHYEGDMSEREPNVEPQSMELLCRLWPEGFEQRIGVIDHHNAEKKLAHVVYSIREGAVLTYKQFPSVKKLRLGTIVDIFLHDNSDGRPQVISISDSKSASPPDFMREVLGEFQQQDGRPFGFIVLPEGERIFVPPELVSQKKLHNSTHISGRAIQAVDKKTGKEGWRLVEFM